MSLTEWPPYRVGNPDYIHALGVIASSFNRLEFRLRALFRIYMRSSPKVAYILFAKLTNQNRLELMYEALDDSDHPESIKEDVRYYLGGFKTCADNRNILMHSNVTYVFGPGDEPCPTIARDQPHGVAFQKWPKNNPFQIDTYELSLDEVREVADAINAFEGYGDRLYWHVVKNYEPAICQAWGIRPEEEFVLPTRPDPARALTPTTIDTG
jgi:hypothetical protein